MSPSNTESATGDSVERVQMFSTYMPAPERWTNFTARWLGAAQSRRVERIIAAFSANITNISNDFQLLKKHTFFKFVSFINIIARCLI